MRLKKLLLLFMFLGVLLTNIMNTYAHDGYECYDENYGSSDFQFAKKVYKEFDIIFIGTIVAVPDYDALQNKKFQKEIDYTYTFHVDELFKNASLTKINNNTINLFSGSNFNYSDKPHPKRTCLDRLAPNYINKQFLIYAKDVDSFSNLKRKSAGLFELKHPKVWGAELIEKMDKDQQWMEESDVTFIGRYGERIKSSKINNNVLTSFTVLDVLKPKTNNHTNIVKNSNVAIWHHWLAKKGSNIDYLIYANKSENNKYIAFHISRYLGKEIEVLRQLSKHKTLKQRWRELWD